jgi:hypothetical protein
VSQLVICTFAILPLLIVSEIATVPIRLEADPLYVPSRYCSVVFTAGFVCELAVLAAGLVVEDAVCVDALAVELVVFELELVFVWDGVAFVPAVVPAEAEVPSRLLELSAPFAVAVWFCELVEVVWVGDELACVADALFAVSGCDFV